MIDHWSLIEHLSSYATPPTGGGGSDCFNLLNLHLLYVRDYKYFVDHLLAVNKVQIQIIIEETDSGSEISSPSSLDHVDKVIFETTKHRSANQRYQVMSYRFRLLNRA